MSKFDNYGKLWASDHSALIYYYASLDFDITDPSKLANLITVESFQIKKNNYKISWNGATDNWETTYKPGSWDSLDWDEKLQIYTEILKASLTTASYELTNDNASQGIQVRCMKE